MILPTTVPGPAAPDVQELDRDEVLNYARGFYQRVLEAPITAESAEHVAKAFLHLVEARVKEMGANAAAKRGLPRTSHELHRARTDVFEELATIVSESRAMGLLERRDAEEIGSLLRVALGQVR